MPEDENDFCIKFGIDSFLKDTSAGRTSLVIADRSSDLEHNRPLCRLLKEEGEFVDGEVQREFLKISNGKYDMPIVDKIIYRLFDEVGNDEDYQDYPSLEEII